MHYIFITGKKCHNLLTNQNIDLQIYSKLKELQNTRMFVVTYAKYIQANYNLEIAEK